MISLRDGSLGGRVLIAAAARMIEPRMGDSLREDFERDGYVVFDPGIPAETLSDAVTDLEASTSRPPS